MLQNSDGTISPRSRIWTAKQQKVINRATQDIYNKARGNSNRGRLYGGLTKLEYHESKMEKTGKEHVCVVCDEICIAWCTACRGKSYMHYQVAREKCKSRQCFLHHHNSSNFGLLRNDCTIIDQSRTDWKPPSDS